VWPPVVTLTVEQFLWLLESLYFEVRSRTGRWDIAACCKDRRSVTRVTYANQLCLGVATSEPSLTPERDEISALKAQNAEQAARIAILEEKLRLILLLLRQPTTDLA